MRSALTHSATIGRHPGLARTGVASRRELKALGCTSHQIDAQLSAGRWRAVGNAVVLHNAAATADDRRGIALINCGPRSVLTSFTAAECWGLRGWERDDVFVLAPAGTTRPPLAGLKLHRVGDWDRVSAVPHRRLHRLAPALVIASSSYVKPRPACGLLAAAVQQRLIRPDALRTALIGAPKTRHRRALLLAVADIAQGADALSEIDFSRLCRRNGLPEPRRQAIRVEPSGRRRYLDAEWVRRDGRVVGAEVDGAIHLAPQRWFDDQLRQNEVVIGGTLLLRFPSVVVRNEEPLVVDQLRRMLR